MSQEWAAQELAGSDLGDARLNKGSVTPLDGLADNPTASSLHACNGWAETQATYQFLAQEEIGWEDILSPHFICAQQRMQVGQWCCAFRIRPTCILTISRPRAWAR